MSSLATWRRAPSLQSLLHQFPVVSKVAINYPVPSWSIGMGSLCHLCSVDIAPCFSQKSPLALQAGTMTGTFPITAGFSLLNGFGCIWLPSPYCRGLTWPRISTQATARRQLSCLLHSRSLIAEPTDSNECKQAKISDAIHL